MELKLGLADYRLLEREEKEEKIKIVKFLDESKATIVTNCGKVKEIRTELLELAQHSWFYSRLSRPFAEQMLKQKDRPIGSFVVRCSQTKSGYALSVKLDQCRIGHFLIEVDARTGNVMIWNMTFGSIQHLVRYFTQRPFYESVQLVMQDRKHHKTGKLIFETFSENQWELSLHYNETVQILTKIDKNWLLVQTSQLKIGLVPRNHVEVAKY
jgi:hypothetical protein